MQAEDLLHFEWVADPQISPDGSRVAFTRVHVDVDEDEYRTSLWMVDTDAAEGTAPRRLTSGPFDAQPRWSPDGTRLAFVRRRASKDPETPGQIWVMPMAGGEAVQVTSLARGASMPAWSPDGARIAFLSGTNPALDEDESKKKPKSAPGRVVTKPQFRWNDQGFVDTEHPAHVWTVDANGGSAKRSTQGEFAVQAPAWSNDGRWILFLADVRPEPWFEHDEQVLYAVASGADAPAAPDAWSIVAKIHGPILAYVEGPAGRIAALGDIRPSEPRSCDATRLFLFEGAWPMGAGAALSQAIDLDFGDSVSGDQHAPRGGGAPPLALSADGRFVFSAVVQHGAAMLARVATDSGALGILTPPGFEVQTGSATPDGSCIACTMGSPESPGDLYLYDVAQGKLRMLFAPNAARMQAARHGEVEEIWFDSFDGQRIQGWIMKPPDFDPKRKYPMILEIHGGPHVPYGVAFFHEFRVLAAAGYVVLYTNPRGSTSYGLEFANCIQYRYPGDDYRDLMAGVDAVLARGYVDETRLGVTGGSGGGLLTNWCIIQSHRFAAAATQRCVADWVSMWYTCDFTMFTPSWFRTPPFEGIEDYLQRSPMHHLAKIETPLLVIHSEEDWRTPIGQGETMFRGLKMRRKPVAMVRFPGENHELSRSGTPSRRVQRIGHLLKWFDHWLMGKPASEYGV